MSSRWPHSFQQRCGFRKVSKKTEPKKVEDPGPAHTEPPEAVVQRRTPTAKVDQQAPLGSPRAFSRLVRPFFFTVGVGTTRLSEQDVTPSRASVDSMSVYRLLLRVGGHLAVRVAQVSSPELLQRGPSRLAGESQATETRRLPQRGEGI